MTPAAYLVRVTHGTACFGLVVVGGVVTEAAPIARWCVGKRGRDAVRYWRRRGATVIWRQTAPAETEWTQ